MSKVKKLQPVVKAAVDLFPHSLHHEVQLDASEAIEYCKAIDDLDEGYDISMLEVVEGINKIVPRFEDNSTHHLFKVGRANSPLLILSIIKNYVSDLEWDSFIQQLSAIAIALNCNEYEVIKNTKTCFEYRFWWDD